MRSSNVHFFATPTDIANVIQDVERTHQMFYAKADLTNRPQLVPIASGLSLPDLGQATSGDTVHCPAYIVTQSVEAISSRAIPQRKGGVLFAVDQLSCPDSVVLRPGGLFERKAIIAGSCGTSTHTDLSKQIYKVWLRAFKEHFRRHQSFMVGPEAEHLLENGLRLTARLSAPLTHDLSKA